MAEVQAGPAARLACDLLAAMLAAYAVPVAAHATRGFRDRLPDRWSAAMATATVLALAAAVWAWGPAQLPAPLSPALAAVGVAAAAFVVLFPRVRAQELLDAVAARLPGWMRWRSPGRHHEERRKWPHLLMGLYVLCFPLLGHLFVAIVAAFGPAQAPAGEGWGNVLALRDAPWHEAGQVAAAWLLVLMALVLLPVELVRLHDPARAYLWKMVIEPRLRERERGLFGAHLHITLGVALAVLVLGRDPAAWRGTVPAAMAVVAVSVFADAASALVGIRWGRRKWPHNAGKSYAGTLGGLAVALLVSVPLVGVWAGAASALLFVAIDVASPRPLPVSDNLLNPLGLALLYGVPGLVDAPVALP